MVGCRPVEEHEKSGTFVLLSKQSSPSNRIFNISSFSPSFPHALSEKKPLALMPPLRLTQQAHQQ